MTQRPDPSRTIIYTGKEFRSDEVKGHYKSIVACRAVTDYQRVRNSETTR